MAGVARGTVLKLTPAEVVARALSLCVVPGDKQARIYYSAERGRNGGSDPEANTCATLWRDRQDKTPEWPAGRVWATSDCVGFGLWAYGRDRLDVDGTWWNQNSIYNDASGARRRWRFCEPYPGCLALIRGPVPGDKRFGHVGVVVEPGRVAHCSPANHKRFGQAIGVTDLRTAFGDRPVYFVERVA